MIEGIFVGVLGNLAYEKVKRILEKMYGLGEKDEDTRRIYYCIEYASRTFFKKYGDKFGSPNESFLAREENIKKIIQSTYYHEDDLRVADINPEGFHGSPRATPEAVRYFLETLKSVMLKDRQLSQTITQKNEIKEIKKDVKAISDVINFAITPKDSLQGKVFTIIISDHYDSSSRYQILISELPTNKIFGDGLMLICNIGNGRCGTFRVGDHWTRFKDVFETRIDAYGFAKWLNSIGNKEMLFRLPQTTYQYKLSRKENEQLLGVYSNI